MSTGYGREEGDGGEVGSMVGAFLCGVVVGALLLTLELLIICMVTEGHTLIAHCIMHTGPSVLYHWSSHCLSNYFSRLFLNLWRRCHSGQFATIELGPFCQQNVA